MRHTAGASFNSRHNLSSSNCLKTLQATSVTSSLSLHDALPISVSRSPRCGERKASCPRATQNVLFSSAPAAIRSEEHTSELQSRFDLVCRLLLEKKNNAAYARRQFEY